MALGVRKRVKENDMTPTRAMSDKQEKAVAKAVRGRQTPNSGASSIKGDVLISSGSYDTSWLIECKTKMAPSESITIKKDWFEKNRYEASEMGKAFTAIAFNFGPDEENHYIIDEFLFQELVELLKAHNNG